MTERMLEALAKLDVRLIAIDEAHCISQWGPAFRPEYEALSRLRDLFPNVPIIALTATADEVTRADIAAQLFAGARRDAWCWASTGRTSGSTVEPKQTASGSCSISSQRHAGESGIVYCLSRKKTEETAAFLEEHGVRALAYHAGMSKEAREANQNRFMTEPGIVMVATIAFGMGIDKSDVRFVFHTDLPASLEAYYQEIGRAGRDGEPAEAHMLFGLGDIRMRRMFIDEEDAGEDRKRREHARLNTLLGYCEAPRCRRQILLGYFGEDASGPAAIAMIASTRRHWSDGARRRGYLLAAVQTDGTIFGPAHIVDILLGHETEKVLGRRHDRLASFGTGATRKKNEWQTLIRQLVGGGLLRIDIGGYGGLKITAKGRSGDGRRRDVSLSACEPPSTRRKNANASSVMWD